MSNKGFKSAVPRLAVVVGSLAGVHSDVVSIGDRRGCRL